MNTKKTMETKAAYSALIAAGFLLTLLSLPSFQLGKLWDGMATLAVCRVVLLANLCLFWEFLSRPAWRKPVIIITVTAVVGVAAITSALLLRLGIWHCPPPLVHSPVSQIDCGMND
jgi:hypothetical protein